VAERGALRTARDRIRSPGTTSVLVGSALSGAGAYVFQVIGTRALGDEAYAPISVLWTIQYLSLTVALVSVEAYLTRTITVHPDDPQTLRRAVARLSLWIGGVAALVGAGAWVWQEPLFHSAGSDLPLVAVAVVLGYGSLVLIRGQLAGAGRFGSYGFVTGFESLVRVLVALPVGLMLATTRSLAWTLPLGTFAVLLWWLLSARRRRASADRWSDPQTRTAGVPLGHSTGRYLLATTTANAASQSLLAAGPLVLVPLGAGPAEISVFFITITAARVPLVFAFGGVLSRVLPSLTRSAQAGEGRRLRRLAVIICASALMIASVGAAAGAWIGPQVVALFFGAPFTPPGWFVALTVAGVTLATAALGLNQILIAMGAELRLVVPWLTGLSAGAVGVLLTQGSPTFRVAAAFVLGEVVALAGLLAALLSVRRNAASR
jgi:O-antigen/teichoic acid export membrane protein